MEVREIWPDDAASVGCFVEVRNAAAAVDAPWQHPATPYRREMEMRHGWDGEVGRHFLALEDGAAVGTLVVNTTEHDNRDLAWLEVDVHPAHRRRGHGTALVDAAYEVMRGMGRTLAGVAGWESGAVRGFAQATGFEQRSQSIQRRQVLAELPAGLVDEAWAGAAARAGDYELLRFRGHSPEELLADLARITESINDAPLDDLEFEDELYSADRVRGYERAQLASGYRLYRVVARHRDTGELAGHTVVTVDSETPAIGNQHDTAVARDHRGHRLGLLLKADVLRWLAEAEPQLATVDTWNAESNAHMIGVNEALGYRPVGRELVFQRRLPR